MLWPVSNLYYLNNIIAEDNLLTEQNQISFFILKACLMIKQYLNCSRKTVEPSHVLTFTGIELGSDHSYNMTMQLPTDKLTRLILH